MSVLLVACNNVSAQYPGCSSRLNPQITVGNTPQDIQINTVTNKIYIANKFSNSVSAFHNGGRYIGFTTFHNGGDIRDVLSVGKLVKKEDGPEAIDLILKTLMKYGKEEE